MISEVFPSLKDSVALCCLFKSEVRNALGSKSRHDRPRVQVSDSKSSITISVGISLRKLKLFSPYLKSC